MGNEGINKLAGVLQSRMKQLGTKPQTLDFGTIQEDMSLITNRFPQAIPKNDYMVCRQLTIGETGKYLTETHVLMDGEHSHPKIGISGAHEHDIKIPETMRKLKPGDRVLVAWVGDDPCIIDIVLSGRSI